MLLPLQITFRDIESSTAVTEHIRMRAERLDAVFPRITSCRVAIESPKRHAHHGKHFTLRIDLTVPGAELVVGRHGHGHGDNDSDGDLYLVIDRTFDRAERVIHEHERKLREQHGPSHAELAERPSVV